MRTTRFCVAFFFVAIFFACSAVRAQVTTVNNTTSTPIPGAGHDYVHLLSETVNPSNGSVSLHIEIPTAKARGFTIPFSFTYNSNGVHHLQPGVYPNYGTVTWSRNGSGGWSNSLPSLSSNSWLTPVSVLTGFNGSSPVYTVYSCNYQSNYSFRDLFGGVHALGLGSVWSGNPPPGGCPGAASPTGGDGQVQAGLTLNSGNYLPSPVTVYDAAGTVYSFNNFALPTSIEDRNGNTATATQNAGNITLTDTLGRQVISVANNNTFTIAGLTYQLTWTTTSASFSVPSTWAGQAGYPNSSDNCSPIPAASDSQTVVSQITLPDGKQFHFYYGTDNPDTNFQNPYGLLSEIDYPSGGWVKYKWKLSDTMNELADYPGVYTANSFSCSNNTTAYCPAPVTDGCLYLYKTPVVASRTVGFGGSSNPSLTQTFVYSTSWANPSTSWTAKSTILTTVDNVTGKSAQTTYSYTPVALPNQPFSYTTIHAQVPVEATTASYDWGNTTAPIRSVAKTWYDQFNLSTQITTLDNGQSTKITYCYLGTSCVPSAFSQVHEVDEYDFGASSPTRKTVTNYQSFSGTPGTIANAPCQVLVQNGSGTTLSETDYLYDGGTSVCGASGSASTTAVASLPAGTHDETTFSSGSTTPRGNATKVILKCLQSCTDSTTSFTYDETGQIQTSIDGCGNATCSDVTGTNHTTQFYYADNFDSNPATQTDAYLTKIIDPLGHSVQFQYAYSDGQLISTTDANSLVTSYLYADPLRRLTETDFPDGGYTKTCYTDAGGSICSQGSYPYKVTARKAINGSAYVESTIVMDGMGHTTQTQLTSDPQGAVLADTTYDGLGGVWKQSNPYRLGTDATSSPGTTTFNNDALGRKLTETGPDGSVINTSYCGPSTLVKDATNKWRRSRTDGLGYLVEVDEPSTSTSSVSACPSGGDQIWVTSYTNDILGNLTAVLQNSSHARSFAYDSLKRMLTSTNPEVGTITYTYDSNNNVSTKRDARNITTTYGYDVLNRLKSRTYSNGDPTVTITYDQTSCLGLSTCQNIGKRTSQTDAAGSESWSYQVDSAHQRTVHANQRTTSGQTKNSTYYLDLAGNITQMVYPSGRTVNYAYDSANRPKSASDATNGLTYATGFQTPPTGTSCVSSGVCYTPQGTPYAISVGQSSSFTGLNLLESANNRLQPNEIKATSTGGNAFDLIYNYTDPVSGKNAGHVFGITNNIDAQRSQTFAYDQLNRLTTAQTTSTFSTASTKCWGETYTVDAWGNLSSIAATTNPAYTGCTQESGFTKTADGNNHVSGFAYDAAGNTTNDGVYFGYQWNAEGQLTYTSGGSGYGYDGAGRRVSKIGGNEPKLYWYGSGGEILTETSPSSYEILDYVYFSGKRVAQVANDTNNLNGGFEQGLTNWSVSGSGTATAITSSSNAHSGSNYVDLVTPANGAATKLTITQPISAQRGETITATGWVYREANGAQYSRWWMQVNGSNGTVGGHPVDNTTMGAWIQQTISATVPTWLAAPYTVTLWAEVDSTSSTQSTSARFDDATLNGNTLLFAEDSLGTTRVVTDTFGAVCYDADFYPFGGERPYTNACTTHYKFEGKERDVETGNDEFGARYYSNRFGRWLSADWSAVPVAIPYANLTNPQTLNLYSMVSDDPESFADLDGHECGKKPLCAERIVPNLVGGAVITGNALKTAGESIYGLAKDTVNQVGTGIGQLVAGMASKNNDQLNTGGMNITLAVFPFVTDGLGGAASEEAATNAAKAAADAAQAEGRSKGAAAALVVGDKTFTDVSTGETRVNNPAVQQALDNVPQAERSDFHGKCAEIGCLNQATNSGVSPQGGTMRASQIRRPGKPKHGAPKPPCSTCKSVMKQMGVN